MTVESSVQGVTESENDQYATIVVALVHVRDGLAPHALHGMKLVEL